METNLTNTNPTDTVENGHFKIVKNKRIKTVLNRAVFMLLMNHEK